MHLSISEGPEVRCTVQYRRGRRYGIPINIGGAGGKVHLSISEGPEVRCTYQYRRGRR